MGQHRRQLEEPRRGLVQVDWSHVWGARDIVYSEGLSQSGFSCLPSFSPDCFEEFSAPFFAISPSSQGLPYILPLQGLAGPHTGSTTSESVDSVSSHYLTHMDA